MRNYLMTDLATIAEDLENRTASYRALARKHNIPKSTLHDNRHIIVNSVSDWRNKVVDLHFADQDKVVTAVLSNTYEARATSRPCAKIIGRHLGIKISPAKVTEILRVCADIAAKENALQNLSKIHAGIGDELFAKMAPFLIVGDAVSAYIAAAASKDRSKESWKAFLGRLVAQGLNPTTFNTDGGASLLGAISDLLPKATRLLDTFHVLRKVLKAISRMEGPLYGLIAKEAKLRKKGDLKAAKVVAKEFDEKERLFARIQKAFDAFSSNLKLTPPEGKGYIPSRILARSTYTLINLLEQYHELYCKAKPIKDAISYLRNGISKIIAYKQFVETLIAKTIPQAHRHLVSGLVGELLELEQDYLRSRAFSVKKQMEAKEKVDFFLEKISQKLEGTNISISDIKELVVYISQNAVKSNSMIESVNSVMRQFFNQFKSIPIWHADLVTFYWNNHRFERGKRKGFTPRELLNNKPANTYGDWIKQILEKYPKNSIKLPLSRSSDLVA